jgi:hypothetical protein
MRFLCSDCIVRRTRLGEAKEALSRFVRQNGHRHDAEVHGALNRLVMEHQAALDAWESHRDLHEAASAMSLVSVANTARG